MLYMADWKVDIFKPSRNFKIPHSFRCYASAKAMDKNFQKNFLKNQILPNLL